MAARLNGNSHIDSRQLLEDLNTKGYFILRAYLPPDLISQLLHVSRKLAAAARQGRWPYLRTCPKQFPPWDPTPEKGIWGFQHLLHPELYRGEGSGKDGEAILTKDEAGLFPALYFHDAIIDIGKRVFQLSTEDASENDDRLIMELFNMLIAPPMDFSLRWHRDTVSFSLTRDEEAVALGVPQADPSNPETHNASADSHARTHTHTHTQYNIPLLPDSSLHLIPSSHLRARTDTELSLLARDPHTDALPGWIPVALEPGDVVFYDNNLIHRGVYAADTERFTLHGSVGDVRGGESRARNVLQHGVGAWIAECAFEDFGLDPRVLRRAERMTENLRALGEGRADVGFAHED